MTLPNVVIIGAPKCGTTSIFNWLSDHPDVCASNVKETCYFIDKDYPLFSKQANFIMHDFVKYQDFFKHCKKDSKVIMESTPDYLYQETALTILPTLNPRPKIIIILRKPSDRIYSLYQFATNNVSTLDKSISFAGFINMITTNPDVLKNDTILKDAIEHSKYANYISKWVEKFGKNNIKILLMENLKGNPIACMEDISDFINIDGAFWKSYTFPRKNESYQVKNQALHRFLVLNMRLIPNSVRRLFKFLYYKINVTKLSSKTEEEIKILRELDQQFAKHNNNLEKLMDIDLQSWK